jgi:ABC-type glycerol-3-phosphate transport system substrate-binding protein
MKKSCRIVVLAICIMFIGVSTVPAQALSDVRLREKYNYGSNSSGGEYYRDLKYPYYSSLLSEYENKGYQSGQDHIIIEPFNIKTNTSIQLQMQSGIGNKPDEVFVWNEDIELTEFEFDIASEGLYEVEIEYYMMPGSTNSAVRSLKTDGEVPFLEAGNLVFPRMWKDEGEPIVNSLGDEVRPKQVEVPVWRTKKLHDGSGLYPEALKFYYGKGSHVIELEYISEPMAISKVTILPAEETPTYEQVEKLYVLKGYREANKTVEFQAETSAIEKSDPTVRRESNGDPSVNPVSLKYRKLNVIGGYRWRNGGQSVSWEFSVPEDGLYKIGVRSLQVWNDGLPSYRKIEIDGKVPFKELYTYAFQYTSTGKWKTEVLKGNDEVPYLFYLESGKHTITMTVTMGNLTPVIHSLNNDTLLLSNMIREIIKVTGSSPDANYDYEFFEVIPDLKDNMETLMESLQEKYDMLDELPGKLPAMANNFLSIKSQVEKMIEDPFIIAKQMVDLDNAQISIGSWYLSIQRQPLLIDYITVGSPGDKLKDEKASIFSKIKHTFINFLVSFKKDYDTVGSVLEDDVDIKSTIDVWVARGTEWAELIKEMADEQFTPKTGIMLNMNILPASQLEAGALNVLMLSITAGNAPDVAVGVSKVSPVEFAIRDAVVDLKQFDDYEEVSKRFLDNIMIPFSYRGGVYALPETMDFTVMFYRKDIINELGIKLPDTREELYSYVLPVLYQNGLQFYYPHERLTTLTNSQHGYSQFLFQHGGSYYTPDGIKSALDTPEAFRAFEEFTELYTHYGVPEQANFFNRMRSGEMPMGIGSYGLYMQLSVAAPELTGRWGIAPVPGTKKQDGVVDRSTGILAQQSDIILKQSTKQEDSWEFLKWWSSTPVQQQFARELEAVIGTEARWNTANVEAFESIPWKSEDLKIIKQQWKWAKEVPTVLGGYFSQRYVVNAWTSVVMNGETVRDSLEEAVKAINRELRMKQEEYGVHDSQR